MQEPLQTIEEVAKQLNVSTRTIFRMLDDKSIEGYKVRGEWRISPSSVQAYLQSRSNLA